MGCGKSRLPEPPTDKSDISIHVAARQDNIEAVKQHLATGADVNAETENVSVLAGEMKKVSDKMDG